MSDALLSARALREAFDAGFAATRSGQDDAPFEAFMAFRTHGQPFALALSDVAGLHVDRKIVPVPAQPSASPALLGLAALRGVLTPVYDLGVLLGVPTETAPAEGAARRWMVVVRDAPEGSGGASVGLAFDAFDAHVRARREDLLTAPTSSAHSFVSFALPVGGAVRPLVNVVALFASVKGTLPR